MTRRVGATAKCYRAARGAAPVESARANFFG